MMYKNFNITESEKKDYGKVFGGFESNSAWYLNDPKFGEFGTGVEEIGVLVVITVVVVLPFTVVVVVVV